MAHRQVRKQVAGITTALALAVLMAGPASTFGLGVPAVGGSDSATSTVQGAVETTQQTAATTVTNVESTVQTTVQTTTAAPQAVTNQVQSTAGAVTAAPKAAAPVHKAPAALPAPHKTAPPASAPAAAPKRAQRTVAAGGAAARPSGAPTLHAGRVVERAKSVTRAARLSTSSAANGPAPPLELAAGCTQLLQTLPAALDLNAVLSVVCSAGDLLSPPGRISTAGLGGDPVSSLGGVVGAIAKRLRGISDLVVKPLGGRNGQDSQRAMATGAAGPADGPLGIGSARGVAQAINFAFANGAATSSAQPPITSPTASQAQHHHGFVSAKPTGTEILSAILILNLAILAGIAMWRAASRWVIPRWT